MPDAQTEHMSFSFGFQGVEYCAFVFLIIWRYWFLNSIVSTRNVSDLFLFFRTLSDYLRIKLPMRHWSIWNATRFLRYYRIFNRDLLFNHISKINSKQRHSKCDVQNSAIKNILQFIHKDFGMFTDGSIDKAREREEIWKIVKITNAADKISSCLLF